MNIHIFIALLFFFLLAVSYFLGFTPLIVAIAFLLLSLISYVYYAKDKRAAIAGTWRVQEYKLHLLALMCGWPGAMIAQQQLRHKTKKRSFRAVFWLTVVLNVSGFVWLHSSTGNSLLRGSVGSVSTFVLSKIPKNDFSYAVRLITGFRR